MKFMIIEFRIIILFTFNVMSIIAFIEKNIRYLSKAMITNVKIKAFLRLCSPSKLLNNYSMQKITNL